MTKNIYTNVPLSGNTNSANNGTMYFCDQSSETSSQIIKETKVTKEVVDNDVNKSSNQQKVREIMNEIQLLIESKVGENAGFDSSLAESLIKEIETVLVESEGKVTDNQVSNISNKLTSLLKSIEEQAKKDKESETEDEAVKKIMDKISTLEDEKETKETKKTKVGEETKVTKRLSGN